VRHWDALYQRQPLPLDAALLALALALHSPLMLLHMKAPEKGAKGKSRLVNIDYIEEQIQKRKEKPVALPPAPPQVVKAIIKKVEAVKPPPIFKPVNVPPPAAPKKLDQLIKAPDASKIEAKSLADKLEQQRKALEGKAGFQKNLNMAGPAKDIKLTGPGAAAPAGSRLSSLAGAGGPALQGKSGFQVSKDAMPGSIGGDDDIKLGGAAAVVVPVGRMARADSSILSPVVKDKGSLQGGGDPSQMASAKGLTGLAGGSGGAGAIATGGSARVPAGGAAAPVKTGKTLADNSLGGSGPAGAQPAAITAPAGLPIPVKRVVRAPKPMFLITGPLQNRAVVQREVPAYPEWARSQAIEAAVVLQFTVTPEGRVKDNIFLVRTTGYPAMDELAVKALRKWLFAPLPPDKYEEQTGTITFNFSVR
jgi:TonB family protein